MPAKKTPLAEIIKAPSAAYVAVRGSIVELVSSARIAAVRSVNALMTASYWEIGRRIVEAEQKGKRRAGYGEQLIKQLSADLTVQFGRGFSAQNLWQMRQFYEYWPILQTVSGELQSIPIVQTQPAQLNKPAATPLQAITPVTQLGNIAQRFSQPWSAYVALLSVKNHQARRFYETEALRGKAGIELENTIGGAA
jgi:DUF1016 N-terminal domain